MEINAPLPFSTAHEAILRGDYDAAIDALQSFIDDPTHSRYRDDALFDLGVTYYLSNQFERAAEAFNRVITEHPEAQIDHSLDKHEVGRTATKSHYARVLCFLQMHKLNKAKSELENLANDLQSGVQIEGRFISYHELAIQQIKRFENQTKSTKQE